MANRPYWEQGKWNVAAMDEITHHLLEDLRKRVYLGRPFYFGVGRSVHGIMAGTSLLDYETDTWVHDTVGGHRVTHSECTNEIVPRGHYIVMWKGELWTNRLQYIENSLVPDPPYEYHRPIRVTHSGTIYKSLKVHKSSEDFTADLAAGNWVVDTSIPHTPEDEDWYTPSAWAANTEYWIMEWLYASSDWQHTVDFNKYHDMSYRQNRMVYGYQAWFEDAGDEFPVEQYYYFYGNEILPIQTDPTERHAPAYYLDAEKFRATYKNKVPFEALIINQPQLMGAVFCNEYTINPKFPSFGYQKKDPFANKNQTSYSNSQYSNGMNLPYSAPWSGSKADCNPKVCGSYLQALEYICDGWVYPADATYIANWQLWTGQSWNDPELNINKYPGLTGLEWAHNCSAFEKLLDIAGCYDWYWDDEFPFYTVNHAIADGEIGNDQTFNGNTYKNGVTEFMGNTYAECPMPAGTWRKFIKHSLGQPHYNKYDENGCTYQDSGVPKFCRAFEQGAPTRGNYSGTVDVWVFDPDADSNSDMQLVKVQYPAGTWNATVPSISEFTTFSYDVVAVATHWNETTEQYENEKDIFKVSGDHVSDFIIGSLVRFGEGTDIADYKYNYAYVLKCWKDESDTFVQTTKEMTDWIGKKVCGNIYIAQRHDPCQVEALDNSGDNGGENNVGLTYSYELTAAALNDMHNIAECLIYIPITPDVEVRGAYGTIASDGDGDFGFVQSAWFSLNGYIEGNPENWLPENNLSEYMGAITVEVAYQSQTPAASMFSDAMSGGGGDPYSEFAYSPEYDTPARLSKTAIRAICPPGTSVKAKVRNYSYNAETDVLTESYGYSTLPHNGAWVIYEIPAEAMFCYYTSSSENGYIAKYHTHSKWLTIVTEPVIAIVEYDRVVTSVFDRNGELDRDRWGFITWHNSNLIDDIKPPLPDPVSFTTQPYAEWEWVEQGRATWTGTYILTDGVFVPTVTYGRELVVGDVVSIGDGKVYKIGADGEDWILLDRANGEDTPLTGSSSGDLRLPDYFALHLKFVICEAEDKEESNPVMYRAVKTAGNMNDIAYQESYRFDVIDRYMSMDEFWQGGLAVSGNGSVLPAGGKIFDVGSDPSAYLTVGDFVYFFGADILTDNYEVLAIDSVNKTVTLDYDSILSDYFNPRRCRMYKVGDAPYSTTDYAGEDINDYIFKPQARDSSPTSNETSLIYANESEPVTAPTKYPHELVAELF